MKPILETLHVNQQRSISAFQYVADDFETPWHFHPQHELTYIESSEGTKFIGDYLGSYEPGELVLVRSNVPHCWKNHAQQNVKSISFVVQWNQGTFSKVPELTILFEMLETANKGILFDKVQSRHLIKELKEVINLKDQELYLGLLKLLGNLSKCEYRTLSEASFIDDISSEHQSRMRKVYDFVEFHFARKIYLKELAEMLHMSEQSFSRFFRKMMGRSFIVFLNEYRIKRACRILIASNKQVSEIAYDCGYENLPFFYRQFKKFTHCSPLVYRRKYVQPFQI